MQRHFNFLYPLCLLALFVFASSCGEPDATTDLPDEAAPTTISTEPTDDGAEPAAPEPTEAPNAVITEGKVGSFTLQQPMPEGGYAVTKEMRTSQEEGETVSVPVYLVKDRETLLLEITPAFSVETEDFTDQPGEILVHNNRFKTDQGIGVGSSIEELMAAYDEVEFWYTYVSSQFVAEAKGLNNIQFLIDPSAYLGKANLQGSDRVIVQKEDFKANTSIVSVRVY